MAPVSVLMNNPQEPLGAATGSLVPQVINPVPPPPPFTKASNKLMSTLNLIPGGMQLSMQRALAIKVVGSALTPAIVAKRKMRIDSF